MFVHEWERLPIWDSQRTLPVEVLQFQREIRLRNRAVGLANSLRGMGQGAQPSYWDRLDEIDVPVLLMAGALDRKFVGIAGQMGVRIAGAELSVVPDAGHAVHLERPASFSKMSASSSPDAIFPEPAITRRKLSGRDLAAGRQLRGHHLRKER